MVGGGGGWHTSPNVMRLACFLISDISYRSFILRTLKEGGGGKGRGVSDIHSETP